MIQTCARGLQGLDEAAAEEKGAGQAETTTTTAAAASATATAAAAPHEDGVRNHFILITI